MGRLWVVEGEGKLKEGVQDMRRSLRDEDKGWEWGQREKIKRGGWVGGGGAHL